MYFGLHGTLRKVCSAGFCAEGGVFCAEGGPNWREFGRCSERVIDWSFGVFCGGEGSGGYKGAGAGRDMRGDPGRGDIWGPGGGGAEGRVPGESRIPFVPSISP